MQRRNVLAAVSALSVAAAPAVSAQAPAAVSGGIGELPTRPVLTLSAAKRLLQAGETEAQTRALAVSIAIVDDGGHLLCAVRLDATPPSTAAIATEKARTAALIRRPGKAFEDLINGGRIALLSIGSLSGMLDGGTPLMVKGQCVGAVGVSGGRPADDAAVIEAVLRALA
jgi:uncharacterized protein GlcG (DUF336 family)